MFDYIQFAIEVLQLLPLIKTKYFLYINYPFNIIEKNYDK